MQVSQLESRGPFLGEAWMNAVMNAELGQLQGPIQARGGYSIFRVIERWPEIYYGLRFYCTAFAQNLGRVQR